jgi:hypothetical protein
MADITIITGNFNVSGTTTLAGTSYIPSGYTNNSFVPFNPSTNVGIYTVRYLFSDGTEKPLPFPGTITGFKAFFNFAQSNEAQLSRHIRTQKWFIRTGTSTQGRIQGDNPIQINSTGLTVPLANPPNFFSQAVLTAYSIDERFNHIEQSGVFALEPHEKIGFGTYQPQEKVDIAGNLNVRQTGIFKGIFLTNNYIPSSSTSFGVSGQIATDSNYIYSHNGIKWRRTALSEW